MKLNLGCGDCVTEGWVNVDYALGARIAKIPGFRGLNRKLNLFNVNWDDRIFIHDLRTQFPWDDCSIEAIYSSHTLEHLTRDQGANFVFECHRVLRVGGTLRIVVPDLRHVVEEYVAGNLHADHFLDALGVLYVPKENNVKTLLAPFFQIPHKCMYDTSSLLDLLRATGFKASNKAAFDSAIDDIRRIETADRTEFAVIAEGSK